MRLGNFILQNLEPILAEWEAFAATQLPAAAGMTRTALRDQASLMLVAIAHDIAATQTPDAQDRKSKGLAPEVVGAPETAASTRALARAQDGFDVNQMVAEYRALRASVLKLWARVVDPKAAEVEDMIRFNEAIDQALAESMRSFSTELERSRNLLLGMLGHDMRNPLTVILITAKYLSRLAASKDVSAAAARLTSSGARIQALLDDLVDFNRTKLGVGINIVPSHVDLEAVFREQLALLRVAHAGRDVALNVSGNVTGFWDANRIHQVLGNLVTNALKYGSADGSVGVSLAGDETSVVFEVANRGVPIPEHFMRKMFEPLTKHQPERPEHLDHDGSLGLGLYITREIVGAHGGVVSVRSDAAETAFTVRLPRLAVGRALS